jgi:hypothetical protein
MGDAIYVLGHSQTEIPHANAFRLYPELAKRVGWGTERRLSAV